MADKPGIGEWEGDNKHDAISIHEEKDDESGGGDDGDNDVDGSDGDKDAQTNMTRTTNAEENESSESDNDEESKGDGDNNEELSSGSDSGSDINSSSDDNDSDSDDDSDDDSEGKKPKDGISDYERLRLERIKRNQERLAALGLQYGALKPKPKKIKRRKSVESSASLEPTRKQSARSSKKRIDYAVLPSLHRTVLISSNLQKNNPQHDSNKSSLSEKQFPQREITPQELKKRDRRKKEKRHNERIPRFVYDEFQRIRSKRKLGLKKAKRHTTKAEREKNHWAKIARKLSVQEQKQASIREKEALKQQKENEARRREQTEREELDCNGMTKKELLREIELRTPELFGILAGHDQEQSATLRKHHDEAKEKEELRKRQSLERKLTVIDALDRFPKAMNEALTKLNVLLYFRAPKDSLPPRRSVRRKHGVAFGSPGQNNNNAANETTTKNNAKSNRTQQQQQPPAMTAFPPATTEPKITSKDLKKKQKGNQQKEPPKKKRKLTGKSIGDAATDVGAAAVTSTKKKTASATNANTSSATTKKKERGMPSIALPLHSQEGVATKRLPATNASTSSTTTKKKKRGRPSLALPLHAQEGLATKIHLADFSASADAESLKHKNNSAKAAPVPSGSSSTTTTATTTKRPRKSRDARFVGGWMSPRFSKELDRSWLERTKPIDNRPIVLVPDDVSKLAGVSAKKTAVFDLGSYVPQAGDIILYYPSAHKDVLNAHPDTLGSRQRNLLRVPLWARANRDRNRLSKEDQKGTIWWTNEWIESLLTPRKKSKKDLVVAKAVQGNVQTSKGAETTRTDDDEDSDAAANRKASLGDYPIICRVEKTYAEFPEDPYAKEKSTGSNRKDDDGSAVADKSGDTGAGESNFVTTEAGQKATVGNRLSLLAAAEAKKKRGRISPGIRLAVVLKPLSPIIAPSEHNGLASGGGLGLAPNFTVVTFPVGAPLESFVIPFCWAYSTFHTLNANETVWIRRASSVEKYGSRSKSDVELCGKGKIVEFFDGAETKESKSNSRLGKRDYGSWEEASLSTSPKMAAVAPSASNDVRNVDQVVEEGDQGQTILTTPSAGEGRSVVRLMGNIDEFKALLVTLTKDGTSLSQAIAAALASEKEFKGTIPIRETSIIVDFFGRYLKYFESKTGSTASSLSSSPQEGSSAPVATPTSPPSLVGLILKTLPLRRGVLVTYDSNRRQLYRASPWNLVTLQPTDVSRSLQDGLLDNLENSLREKAILCMKDLIDNNPRAQLFVPIVTELIAPAYYSAVPVGMSFDRILARLKAYGNTGSCYYTSIESLLMDLNSISENCMLYNNPESELVAYCSDIISTCRTLIKDIVQNRTTKSTQKIAETDLGGKRQALIIPSFLNMPFKGEINWEWLQQITPSGPGVDGEKVTRQAMSSTWIPQCGESIFYSSSNHSKFASDYSDSLGDILCSVPDFQRMAIEKQSAIQEESPKEKIQEDEFLAKISSHWLEGTVMSVRSSFPRPARNKNEGSIVVVTPILIVELRLHYTQCEGNTFVCWRPTFEGSKYKGSGLAHDSFLKPTWMSTDGMQIFPSNSLQVNPLSSISKDMSISITKCFDLLKQRCMDGISPDAINPDLALENAEHGATSNFDSQYLPSYSGFFTHAETKYGTRGIKRAGYKTTLKILSEAGYMPLWSLEALQNRDDEIRPRHKSWMSFPSLCLELIRLRISSGYYKNLHAVVNDISESYVGTVLFLLSEPWTRSSDRVSIRKIAKYLMSPRGNGKMSRISVKKKSKKKKNDDKGQNVVPVKKKAKASKESTFVKLSEEEEALTQRIFQIRKYHAAAVVFAREASHVEKIFCLVSTVISNNALDEIPDIDASKTANFNPYQLDGVGKIRRLLHAVGRDPCRNRFNLSYRDIYKVRIKCGEQFITENGHLETANEESILFEPSDIAASLSDGSQMKLRVRCGNQDVCGEKKIVSDRPITEVQLTVHDPGHSSQITDPNKFYHSSLVGRNYFNFNSTDFTNNEELVRTLFGSPGRMHCCVRCESFCGSLFSCRVLRQHSNPDYDFVEIFKGTPGVDSLLNPWKQADGEGTCDMATTESNKQYTGEIAANSQPPIIVNEEAKIVDAAIKEAEEKKLTATLAKQASDAKENFDKADKAHRLAGYLYSQAILLSGLKVKLPEDFISTNFPFDPVDNHYVFCIHCGCAGDLLICDGCPNVSHPTCAGLKDVPDGDWFCHKCTAKKVLASNAIVSSEDVSGESHRNIENSNDDAKQLQESSSQKDQEQIGDNYECAKTESSEKVKQITNQGECRQQAVQIPASMETENPSSLSSNLTSNQTNVVPNSNGTVIESESKVEGPEGEAQLLVTDAKLNAETEAKPIESSATTNTERIKDHEQSKQIIDPEINDKEFEEKESELDKLLTDLIQKRLPPKANPQPVEQQEEERDPMDALGDTYVREFLSFINITSAKQLLSTKSGLIAEDLEIWRKEKGMKPFAGKGYSSAVSMWKNVVRKASGIAGAKADRKDHNDLNNNDLNNNSEALSTNKTGNNLQSLPSQGRKFCSFLGIIDAEVFLATRSSELSRKYASWRKTQNMSKLAGTGPSAYIAVWKSKIRKALASSSIETEYNERGRDVPNGFRVRKIFEDGNYYEGQVISGPSRAFDEEKGKMVLCWRVKYLDDDEEEFTVEELDLWGMDKNLVYKDGDSVASSLDAKGTKLVGIVDWEQHRSEEIVSPPKTSSEDNDRSSDASKDITSTDIASTSNVFTGNVSSVNASDPANITSADNTSTDIAFTSNYSSGNASSGISSRDFISTGIAYRGNTSIGKKVQDLQFTRTNSAIPDEESKPAKVEKTSKAKSEQNASDWDSSPLAIKPRVSSANGLQKLPVPCSTSLDSSPSMRRRRNPRRLSVPTAAAAAAVDDDKPTEDNASFVKDEPSSANEAPLETSGIRRRSTRNRSSEEAITTEASRVLSSRSEGRGRRKSARGTTATEATNPTKGIFAASNTAATKTSSSASKQASEAAAPRDIGRRRSTRGRPTCAKGEQLEVFLDDNAKGTDPPREGRSSARVSL